MFSQSLMKVVRDGYSWRISLNFSVQYLGLKLQVRWC